jgi:Fur family iron response transcriptional regulator
MVSHSETFQETLPIEESDFLAPSEVRSILKSAHLRPTRQRVELGTLIFRRQHWHLTPDQLHALAAQAGFSISLATVYNTLNQFAQVGLIRRVATQGSDRAYFDTDMSDHQHFCVEDEGRIWDAPKDSVRLDALPEPPDGYRIANVDVVIRLARIPKSHLSAKAPASGAIPFPKFRHAHGR